MRHSFLLFLVLSFCSLVVSAQQVADTSYHFTIKQVAYSPSKGPTVAIDEAHHNFHTKEGRFSAFAHLLEADGYQVVSSKKDFTKKSLKEIRLLVISNALNAEDMGRWVVPNPSAFTPSEIKAVKKWVSNGGRLLLIADHMPFAGAATALGEAFGFDFVNGFAKPTATFWPPAQFTRASGMLTNNPVSIGLKPYEYIDSVATFTGSAFKAPVEAIPVLQFQKGMVALKPDTAWRFHPDTPSVALEGYDQGAILTFGKGKIAVFGEAAMFSAQVSGNIKAGFNSSYAPENAQFLLNLIHWLDDVASYSGPKDVVMH